MKIFNGFINAVKSWFKLEAELAIIKNQLNSIERRLSQHEMLILQLYERIDQLYNKLIK